MPAYNERYFVRECVRRVLAAELPPGLERELIIVDDASTDGTGEILAEIAGQEGAIRLLRHERNQGKGASIRTAVAAADGDILLIQDADLEYDPRDYKALLAPILDGEADAVYGSRFMVTDRRRALLFWHTVANRAITMVSNIFTNLNLTDMETCYKTVRAPFLKNLPIRCDRFGIEPELTAKLAKQRCRIYEVPIRYAGRTYDEGKKIGTWDGIKAFWIILWFWLIDDLYGEDEAGRAILGQLSYAPHFNQWMAETVSPWVGHRVLEIGAGIGSLTARLCRRELYVTTDADDYYCSYLSRRFANRPNMLVRRVDATRAEDFRGLGVTVDTLLCLNVLEHLDDDEGALRNFHSALEPAGRLVLLVPQCRWLYGAVDEALGHRRRYHPEGICASLRKAGFDVETSFSFNRVSTPAWFVNGRLLRRPTLGAVERKVFNSLVWLFKRIDPLLPWPGQSLIVIA
ncbi:MAG TPA: glycosyl transferase, partial [Elusimicrobia bacterium]|nr:glycosyl transferase [Elusimicrobiota bacterium]